MQLTAKFHHPTLGSCRVDKHTEKLTYRQGYKQTDTALKTSTSLRYATPVGKKCRPYMAFITILYRKGTVMPLWSHFWRIPETL